MASDPDDVGLALPVPTSKRQRRRLLLQALVRIVLVGGFLLVAYFAVPIGQDADAIGVTLLVLGGIGCVGALVFQVRAIIDSPTPQLRAAEALATTGIMVIMLFAFTFVCMSESNPASFSQPITKVTGLYFTVTVLATVGFGDVTPTTDTARLVVTGQMILNLLIVGFVVRLLLGASRIGLERRRTEAAAATGLATGRRRRCNSHPGDAWLRLTDPKEALPLVVST